MGTVSIIQGCGILLTVLLAALHAGWRIRSGIRADRDIFLLIGGTAGLILLALVQVAALIARDGTTGN